MVLLLEPRRCNDGVVFQRHAIGDDHELRIILVFAHDQRDTPPGERVSGLVNRKNIRVELLAIA